VVGGKKDKLFFRMSFYRATYTSLGGSVADFVFYADEECKTMGNLVHSAFKQLYSLYIYYQQW